MTPEAAPTHPELEQHGSFAHLKLGAKPPTPHPNTLELARYLDLEQLPKPPSKVVWGSKVPAYPMYGNDTLGDCTAAAMAHMIQTWTSEAGKYREPTDAAVRAMYFATGDGADDGRQLTDILSFMQKTGLEGDKILGWAEVNLRSHAERDAAHWLFGGLYSAVALPLSAQTQPVWAVVADPSSSAPGSWGYHCVPTSGRWPNGWQLETWGARLDTTEAFLERYFVQMIAIVTQDWIDAQEESPIAGVNLALLEKDLAGL